MQTLAVNSAKEEIKKIPPIPSATATAPASASSSSLAATSSASAEVAAHSTTPDERLALALKHLGAQPGPRGEVLLLQDVSFGADQTEFKAGNGGDFRQVVTLLRDYPNALLIIEGYTDNRGSEQFNERLSLQRAKSVQQALVADGLNATRIRARGRGSADPIADNGTTEGRAENRRVELVFSNSAGTFASAADQITAG